MNLKKYPYLLKSKGLKSVKKVKNYRQLIDLLHRYNGVQWFTLFWFTVILGMMLFMSSTRDGTRLYPGGPVYLFYRRTIFCHFCLCAVGASARAEIPQSSPHTNNTSPISQALYHGSVWACKLEEVTWDYKEKVTSSKNKNHNDFQDNGMETESLSVSSCRQKVNSSVQIEFEQKYKCAFHANTFTCADQTQPPFSCSVQGRQVDTPQVRCGTVAKPT